MTIGWLVTCNFYRHNGGVGGGGAYKAYVKEVLKYNLTLCCLKCRPSLNVCTNPQS
jgi:hypothetical protein